MEITALLTDYSPLTSALILSVAIITLVLTAVAVHVSHAPGRRGQFIILMTVATAATAIRGLGLAGEMWAEAILLILLAVQPSVILRYSLDKDAITHGTTVTGMLLRRGPVIMAVVASGLAAVSLIDLIVQRSIPGLALAALLALQGTAFVGGVALLATSRGRGWSIVRRMGTTLGFALAFAPALVATNLPLALGYPPQFSNVQATIALALFPLTLITLSARINASSILLIIDRLSVYVILAGALLLAYSLVALTVQRAVETHISRVGEIVTLVLSITAAMTYAPLRGRLQRAVDTVLYKDYYEFGPTLQRFSQELAMLREEEDVINFLLDALTDTLNLTGIAFVSLPEGLDERVLALIEPEDLRARRDFATVSGRAHVVSGLASLSVTKPRLTGRHPLSLHPWPGCAAVVLVGSSTGDQGIALLVIGEKQTSSPLRRDDKALLVTVAHHAATALANAVLLSGLKTSLAQVQISTAQLVAARSEQQLLLRELVNADERQRASLAQDLHDDALQEVLYLIRHSRLCAHLADELERETRVESRAVTLGRAVTRPPRATLTRLREEVDQLAERSAVVESRLRALYMGLYPALLNTIGLPAALEELAKELSIQAGMDISFECDEHAAELALDLPLETILHVYRIAQEALRNASKHAQATSATLRLCVESQADRPGTTHQRQALCLLVEDNGPGIPTPVDYLALLHEGHLGLAGMRERATRIGGTLEVTSGSDCGTRVTFRLPVRSGRLAAGRTSTRVMSERLVRE